MAYPSMVPMAMADGSAVTTFHSTVTYGSVKPMYSERSGVSATVNATSALPSRIASSEPAHVSVSTCSNSRPESWLIAFM